MVLGLELFGRFIPGRTSLVIVGLMIVFFIFSRLDAGGTGQKTGRGRMHRCKRCGRDFQPEQVELLQNGDVRTTYNDHCPNCGWDLDWGSPDKPGGSSGSW